MRHSRRNVMAEQYKLYIRKNILNGRYFVRNIQIGLCIILTIAVVIGSVVLIRNSGNKLSNTAEVSKINDPVSVKEALFGSTETLEKEVADNNEDSFSTVDSVSEESTEKTSIEVETTESSDIKESVENIDNIEDNDTVAAISETGTDVLADIASADEKEEVLETKGEFDDRCIAYVDETLNVRKEPSRDAEFVGQMENGSIAKVLGTEGEWTKIKSGEVEGYVLSEYVLTGRIAEEYSKDYVTVQGTAKEDGINVRENRSTDADIIKVLDKDDVISVVEMPDEEADSADVNDTDDKAETEDIQSDDVDNIEGTEDITWLTIMLEDGQIGYVSADYVDIDKLYTLAVSAEELIRREEERAAAERAAAEAALLAAQETVDSSPSDSDNSSSYHGATTTPVTATESGDCLGTFTITAYCGCSKCSGGHNKTATGTTPTQGRTIAADPSVLPYGTQVVIGGVVYTVEDCGSGVNGNHIDIFFATHEDALAFGSKTMKVYKY